MRRRYQAHAYRPRRKAKMTLPLMVVGGFMPLASGIWERRSSGLKGISQWAGQVLLGYNQSSGAFNMGDMRWGLYPIIAGFGLHMLASKLGINRFLARMKIPLIRL